MSSFHYHPYQCLAAIPGKDCARSSRILAACFNRLILLDDGGAMLDYWPRGEESKGNDEDSDSSTEIITATANGSNGERPGKRRKKSSKHTGGSQGAPITAVIVSHDGLHAVATTGEGKAIHVFSFESDDRLVHLSQRRMTKRPCAIAFSQNGKSILVGDKFGDVYALPLHHDPSAVTQTAAKAVAKPSAAPFRPAATNLTVHSKRNLTALENQQRQAANPQHSGKEKEAMDFEHELLLGHVSMLTDLVIATSRVSHVRREYIITADRDEHIRVSRGQPQAHIIENYCFGHTAFVSRLCLANDDTLVSGGGDDYLCVWDWRYGRLLTKLNLREAIAQHSRPPGSSQTPPANVTVSTLRAHSVGDSAGRIAIFCACEATAAIVVFEIDVSQPLGDVTEPTHVRHLPARHGNVLDVVVHETGLRAGKLEYRLIVSLDSLHRPNSKEVGADAGVQLIQVTRDGFGDMPAQAIEVSDDAVKQSVDLLYGLDKLRKKGGEDE